MTLVPSSELECSPWNHRKSGLQRDRDEEASDKPRRLIFRAQELPQTRPGDAAGRQAGWDCRELATVAAGFGNF